MHAHPSLAITPSADKRQVRMLATLAISAALHALLLLSPATEPGPLLQRFGSTWLSVRLQGKDTPRHSHISNVFGNRTGSGSENAMDAARTAAMPPETAAASPESRTSGAAPSDSNRAAVENYLLGALRAELLRYLVYPPLARERGWEGTVLLRVVVAPNGTLVDTRLVRSSGYAVFDRVSLDTMRRIRGLPLDAHTHLAGNVEVLLPIEFRLIDNT